jgi:hypothetical protein
VVGCQPHASAAFTPRNNQYLSDNFFCIYHQVDSSFNAFDLYLSGGHFKSPGTGYPDKIFALLLSINPVNSEIIIKIRPWSFPSTHTHTHTHTYTRTYATSQFVGVVVWGPDSGYTAACSLIVHTPCVFNVATFTARRLHVTTTLEILAAKGGMLGEKCQGIWPKVASSTLLSASFACRKSATWDRRLYFPSEWSRTEDFFVLKNPTASAEFEPANLGTKGQHATPKPPKPQFSVY